MKDFLNIGWLEFFKEDIFLLVDFLFFLLVIGVELFIVWLWVVIDVRICDEVLFFFVILILGMVLVVFEIIVEWNVELFCFVGGVFVEILLVLCIVVIFWYFFVCVVEIFMLFVVVLLFSGDIVDDVVLLGDDVIREIKINKGKISIFLKLEYILDFMFLEIFIYCFFFFNFILY